MTHFPSNTQDSGSRTQVDVCKNYYLGSPRVHVPECMASELQGLMQRFQYHQSSMCRCSLVADCNDLCLAVDVGMIYLRRRYPLHWGKLSGIRPDVTNCRIGYQVE